MTDINNFYMLLSNRQSAKQGNMVPCMCNCLCFSLICIFFSVYWMIKKIHIETVNRAKKFDNRIFAIRTQQSIPKLSTVLWTVRTMFSKITSFFVSFQDPKKQQWKIRTSTTWSLRHSVSKGEITLKLFEGGRQIVDAKIQVVTFTVIDLY